jgi:aspartyl-tRNA(Asn)/glutamyl-tRNA(Gln) amidotransferase subunit B
VQFLGVSAGQMQMGHMRFEPNINVHITDSEGKVHKTAITEIKNLNSFSVIERATDYEIARQLHEWQNTGSLGKKSTYGWDEASGSTYWQRDKEEAGDYRYFPDPDLMPVEVDDAWLTELKQQVGELPQARRKRYISALGLSPKDAAILAGDRATGDFFEQIIGFGADPKRASTLMEALREIANERNEQIVNLGISAGRVAEIATLVAAGKLAGNKETARTVIASLAETDRPAEQAATELGIIQSTDTGEVDKLIDALIAENPKSLQDYKGGKQQARGALIGMIMKKAKGLNAKIVGERIDAKVL